MPLIPHLEMSFQNPCDCGRGRWKQPCGPVEGHISALGQILGSCGDELIMESFRIKVKIPVSFEMCCILQKKRSS